MIVKKKTYKVEVIDVEGVNAGDVRSEQNRISGEGYSVSTVSEGFKTGSEDSKVYHFSAEKWEEI